jgi:Mu transposase, C-terminal domain
VRSISWASAGCRNACNKYSVSADAVGRPVEVHAYAERLVIWQEAG